MNDTLPPLAVFLRPMTIADLQTVHAVDVLSFSLPWSERSYRFELTENKNALPWVAEVEQSPGVRVVVGLIVVWVILDEAHVATIAVHPDYRQHGIGRRLLAQALLAAHERGATLSFLEVRRGNLAAQKMYFDFGFFVAGERLRYYQDNHEDALLLTLDPIQPAFLQDELSR